MLARWAKNVIKYQIIKKNVCKQQVNTKQEVPIVLFI
jgi:hypothetical protein